MNRPHSGSLLDALDILEVFDSPVLFLGVVLICLCLWVVTRERRPTSEVSQ